MYIHTCTTKTTVRQDSYALADALRVVFNKKKLFSIASGLRELSFLEGQKRDGTIVQCGE